MIVERHRWLVGGKVGTAERLLMRFAIEDRVIVLNTQPALRRVARPDVPPLPATALEWRRRNVPAIDPCGASPAGPASSQHCSGSELIGSSGFRGTQSRIMVIVSALLVVPQATELVLGTRDMGLTFGGSNLEMPSIVVLAVAGSRDTSSHSNIALQAGGRLPIFFLPPF